MFVGFSSYLQRTLNAQMKCTVGWAACMAMHIFTLAEEAHAKEQDF